MKKRKARYCLGIYNCDTESTSDGWITAFMADWFESRLVMDYPKQQEPTKKYLRAFAAVESFMKDLPLKFRSTSQKEIRSFFDQLQDVGDKVQEEFEIMASGKEVETYFIVNFANLSWDFDVLQGIAIDPDRSYNTIGDLSNFVQFMNGHVYWRDFLRMTGFSSIKTAGMVCTSAKKMEGESVYSIRKEDIPEHYEDYSEEQRIYMENDVAVMDEALNIILNRKENQNILTMTQLPLTATSFGRFRMQNNDEIVVYDGQRHNVAATITASRWKYARPHLPYLIRGYKGGYCGPNPHTQFKLLGATACFDAISMYPDKIMFHKMMQFTEYSREFHTTKTWEQLEEQVTTTAEDQIRLRLRDAVDYYNRAFDAQGQLVQRPDSVDGNGLMPWIGTVVLDIYGVRTDGSIYMMPFLSEHKIESNPKNLKTCNGKILSGVNVEVILTSLDLVCVLCCYRCKIVRMHTLFTLGWRDMLYVQKRDLFEAYKRKMHISSVIKQCVENDHINRENFAKTRDYWEHEAGFNFDVLNSKSDQELITFFKFYKQMIKADPNGKYGMTVEKPIHPKVELFEGEDQLPRFKVETMQELADRLLSDPLANTPAFVRTQDYCSGSSITMWARWQLITLMRAFFQAGLEVYYCDTDSEFVNDCPASYAVVEEYNKRKKTMYYSTKISKTETVTVDDCEGLGQFDLDKKCEFFKTLGAKNYGYLKPGGGIKLTIAGLKTKSYEDAIKAEMAKRPDLKPETVFDAYYRPNTAISSSVARKLIKDRSNIGYVAEEWRGPVLVPVGFYVVNHNSKFHINNMCQAARMQNLPDDTYFARYQKNYYLTEKGFKCGSPIPKSDLVEGWLPLENNDILRGGLVNNGQ